MLLEHKTAVIYGAGGAIGGAVARAFAREGATVFLTGRTLKPLTAVVDDITAAGGTAETAAVDALDADAIAAHLDAVVAAAGRIDVSFNAIGIDDVQGTPFVDLSLEDFTRPITLAMRTQFLTATAAARRMVPANRGVIMAITATPARLAIPNTGGFGPACAAIEGFSRQLAGELGPHGVRVVCLRSAGSPDAPGLERLTEPGGTGRDRREETFADLALLRRLPALAEVGNVAALMASDYASPMTGTVANLTCGTVVD